MSKLIKNANSGGNLDALSRASTHAIMLRHIVHTLLCIAALVLGFSISREALLVVVSFRLPYGSLFVQTTTHTNGQVAIISFPRMKQTRAFSGPDFSVSPLTNDQRETRIPVTKELSASALGGNGQVNDFSETKILIQERLPSIHPSHLETASRSSRVHVGRHEILIRPYPNPDPTQTASALRLMTAVQEEQQRVHDSKERKPLLVITPFTFGAYQLAGLTSLMHTLMLVRTPVTWIVVEAGNVSNETVALLANSKLSLHHLVIPDISGNIKERLMTEALRYIHDQHIEGVVVFADESITYNLEYFDKVQKVKWIGAFVGNFSASLGLQGDEAASCESAHEPASLISSLTNASDVLAPFLDPCTSITSSICWYSSTKNELSAGDLSFNGSTNWSAFAFNATLLWEGHKLSWIKSFSELFAGNQSVVQSPVDLVKNFSHIESLGRCNHLAL
ncbi:hypothetical protein L7F22_045273 [Adiantum nelumboides]|nr:hypothetical protein [Adiantum nelumboides]